tara:strand:+ start:271 stop:498 length:228 start_codon:yes stop_codon:yes gene_type:complete
MKKSSLHNGKFIHESIIKKNYIDTAYLDSKRVVDINKLLNRVKVDKKNETKRQIIFFSSVVLLIGFLGTFITVIK